MIAHNIFASNINTSIYLYLYIYILFKNVEHMGEKKWRDINVNQNYFFEIKKECLILIR